MGSLSTAMDVIDRRYHLAFEEAPVPPSEADQNADYIHSGTTAGMGTVVQLTL